MFDKFETHLQNFNS